MVEIFLLWTFVNGAVYDVDSFSTRAACDESFRAATQVVAMAKLQRPELAGYVILPCVSAEVALPKPPPRETI